ncbi:MAG: hypothetical protein K2Y21_12890 [Phycisphaerales bacterium]|nr:hypothetical protein [Phycisphaerales bacterium]
MARTTRVSPSALDFYELCVTEPRRVVPFLHAVHGRKPLTLREDFSGSAALARAWAASSKTRKSIAVDADPEPLRRARGARVRAVVADVLRCAARADIIAATNFPVGYCHTRKALSKYLRSARSRLNRHGVLVFDVYGGRDAYSPGKIIQLMRAPVQKPWSGELVEYTFEQRAADPVTGLVRDVLHFRAWREGKGVAAKRASRAAPDVELTDAFVYDWRLWSLPELRDALSEAGFGAVEVYDRLGDAIDSEGVLHLKPVAAGEELDANWVVYVVARK